MRSEKSPTPGNSHIKARTLGGRTDLGQEIGFLLSFCRVVQTTGNFVTGDIAAVAEALQPRAYLPEAEYADLDTCYF